ncbi:hypothetical protein HDV05_005809 [Chytridiales sp. JEL 0842]|nr:hypothetical protein HDV05_005809 [Chytridiales sp. JEL 0842]
MLFTLFIYLLISFLTFPLPGRKVSTVVAGDRKLIELPTSWYDSVSVSKTLDVDAFLYHSKPPLNVFIPLPPKVIYPHIVDGSYHFVRYDLYGGSKVQLNWLFSDYNVAPTFMVIEGEGAFNSFRQGDDFGNVLYESNSPRGDLSFTVPYRSQYYFVFYGRHYRTSAKGMASFIVNSKTLDLTFQPPDLTCLASDNKGNTCVMDLRRQSGDTAYLVLVSPILGDAYDVTVYTTWKSSVFFNVIMYGVVLVAGVGLLSSCCCGCCYYRREGYIALPVDEEAFVNASEAIAPPPPLNPAYSSTNPTAPSAPAQDDGSTPPPPPYSPFT